MLVGGFGTRLRPLTNTTPKQMLAVVHRPMLEWVVEGLARHGVDEAVLALGYRPDLFRAAYPDDRCAGVTLRYAVDPEPLDTAGAIAHAAREAGIGERFLVVNGDVITDLDVTALVAFHDGRGAEASIALHAVDDPSAFGVVDADAEGRVRAFVEKPLREQAPSNLINGGMYVFEPSVLDRIPAGRRTSVERETFPAMVADRTLYALDDGGAYWVDTGTPQQYLRVQLDILDGRLGPSPAAVDPTARVAATAIVCRSVIDAGAVIGEGATVEDAVVLAGAMVGAGAHVAGSIVGPGATVGEGAEVVSCSVLGAGAVVLPRARAEALRIPEPA